MHKSKHTINKNISNSFESIVPLKPQMISNSKSINIAIAKNHDLLRQALILLLNKEENINVTIEAKSGIELIERLQNNETDIILMDTEIFDLQGVDVIKSIVHQNTNQKIIAISQNECSLNIIEMIINGVKSFVDKNDNAQELTKAINIVFDGGVYISDNSAKIIQNNLNKSSATFRKNELELGKLSSTEILVLWYSSLRSSVKEIANILYVSPNTIRNHQYSIRKKIGLKGRNSLADYAIMVRDDLEKLKIGNLKGNGIFNE